MCYLFLFLTFVVINLRDHCTDLPSTDSLIHVLLIQSSRSE